MQKSYKPGTFIEIDDLYGGRKCVMVAKDRATYWDDVNRGDVTPITIHAIFKPKELGTLMEFVTANKLQDGLGKVIDYFAKRMDNTIHSDPLYIMRIMWSLAEQIKRGGGVIEVAESAINAAIANAQDQSIKAQTIHNFGERYSALA